MLADTHAQIMVTLTVSGATLLVMAVFIGGGYVRDCSGQHAGAGPGATTVAHIQAHLTAEAARRPVTPKAAPHPEAPDEYTGRHRLPESHPDHGVPLDTPRQKSNPNPCQAVDNWVPCGLITAFPKG